jgi:L-threonylcarbamoyladenylate synthase
LPPQVQTLLAAHEEPLTIIYPSAQGLAAGVCAQDGSVAARIAKHKFCTAITAALGCPIVSTSANISGNTAPTCLSCVDDDIKIRVDLIVDEQWEGCPTRRPSSIVQICEDGSIRKVR